jgi:hypothetical protein
MKIIATLKDGVTVTTVDAASVDLIHSATDPKMLVITVGGVVSYWIDEENFEFATIG